MRKIFTLIALIVLSTSAFSQSRSATIQFKKQTKPSLLLELPNTVEETEGTLLSKLRESGYNPETQGSLFWKKNTQDGFFTFKQIRLTALGSQPVDLYFKIQKLKRSEKTTQLFMLISHGNENFIGAHTDAGLWNNAELFLNDFVDNAVAYSLEQEIKAQDGRVKTLQTKLKNLEKDQKDLEDRISKFQKDLEANKTKQLENQSEIENQSKVLDSIISRRKL